jgi:hypothetical protein
MQIYSRSTLWRLYTDTAFRKEFIFDKHLFYHTYDIPIETIDFLENISIDELMLFADTVLKKRMKKVQQLLPCTFTLIGKDIQYLFFKFCDYHTFSGIRRHQDDAVRFVGYLLKQKEFLSPSEDKLYIRAMMLFEQHQLMNQVFCEPSLENNPQIEKAPAKLPVRNAKQKKPIQQFSVVEDWLKQDRRGRNRKTRYREQFYSVSFANVLSVIFLSFL